MVAHLIDESSRCQLCGTYEWEWQVDHYAYEPATRTCRGCQVLDMAREDAQTGPGISMILIPKTKAQELRERRR